MITRLDRLQGRDIYENTALAKLNEVIDAVNNLQKDYDNVCIWVGEQKLNYNPDTTKGLSTLVEEPELADQCEWLGKLCKFWDGDEQMSHLRWGILYAITPTSPVPFCCSLGDGKTFDYEHCEPVKPDDPIIYKGE